MLSLLTASGIFGIHEEDEVQQWAHTHERAIHDIWQRAHTHANTQPQIANREKQKTNKEYNSREARSS